MDAKLILTLILVSSIILPFGYYFITEKKRKKTFKAVMACNVFVFFGTLVVGTILLFSGSVTASAAETTAAAASIFSTGEGLKYIAAALSTGMSTIGAGIAVASAASAALGALSEDSSIMGKALIFVALAEGVALYGMLISFMILNA